VAKEKEKAGSLLSRIIRSDGLENSLIAGLAAGLGIIGARLKEGLEQNPHERRGELLILLREMGADAQNLWERLRVAKTLNRENELTAMLCMVAFPEREKGAKTDEVYAKKALKLLNESAANDDTWAATIEVLDDDIKAEKLRWVAGHVRDHVAKLAPSAETREALAEDLKTATAWLKKNTP
jgi:hypothetical protein